MSRAIIKIIIDEKLNENLRWIKFDEFKAKQKYIITGYELDLEENEINKLIEAMNNTDILTFDEKKDTNENLIESLMVKMKKIALNPKK